MSIEHTCENCDEEYDMRHPKCPDCGAYPSSVQMEIASLKNKAMEAEQRGWEKAIEAAAKEAEQWEVIGNVPQAIRSLKYPG